MSKNIFHFWNAETKVWNQTDFSGVLSFGEAIYVAELCRLNGVEAYVEGDLIGELAAKAGISRAAAEIEYERPEWAA